MIHLDKQQIGMIYNVADRALKLAKYAHEPVCFVFNDVEVIVHEHDAYHDVLNRWEAGMYAKSLLGQLKEKGSFV